MNEKNYFVQMKNGKVLISSAHFSFFPHKQNEILEDTPLKCVENKKFETENDVGL